MNTPTPKVQLWTFAERMGGSDAVDFLLAELREDLVNTLDAAMGQCPHEGVSSKWDICNACAADCAVTALRELLDAERV